MSKKSVTRANPITCQFPFADGRHCRMPVASSHPYLCLFHADRERRLSEQHRLDSAPGAILAELTSFSGEIKTASDLNRVLTRLWALVAARRVDRFTAANLAYIASLIRQTLPGVRSEISQAQGMNEWYRTVFRSFSPAKTVSDGQPTSCTEP